MVVQCMPQPIWQLGKKRTAMNFPMFGPCDEELGSVRRVNARVFLWP